jgi:hypothetical protein
VLLLQAESNHAIAFEPPKNETQQERKLINNNLKFATMNTGNKMNVFASEAPGSKMCLPGPPPKIDWTKPIVLGTSFDPKAPLKAPAPFGINPNVLDIRKFNPCLSG